MTTTPSMAPPLRGWPAFREAHLYDYNVGATRFWLALAAAGVLALGCAFVALAAAPAAQVWHVVAWMAVVAAAAAFPIQIPRSKHSIAAGDIVIYLLLALHGVPAAVLGAALEGLIAASRTSARLTSRVATGTAAAAAMALAGLAGEALRAATIAAGVPGAAAHLLVLAVAALLNASLTTAALMKVVHLKRAAPMTWHDWYTGASWVGTLHLVSALLAGMLSLNAQQFGHSALVVGVFVIAVSLVLLRAHFRQQIAEHDAQEARLRTAEQQAQQNLKRFHSAFSQASIGMAIVSAEGIVLQANKALRNLLARPKSTLLRRPFHELLHDADAELLDRHVADVLDKRRDTFSIELRCRASQGNEIWVLLHCALFDEGGGSGAGLIYQLHDISSRRRAEGELRHIAYHDALTDLPNRSRFHERLTGAVERHRQNGDAGFAVMMLDLDRFKLVNDSLGHGAGDVLLKEVARRLAHNVRPLDLVARLGGDEFAILLEGAQLPDEAKALGERLLRALAEPLQVNGTELRPTASIGLTFGDMGYREPEEVMRDADLAMYEAKSAGRARVALFDARMHEQLGHKLQLEADLRRAIGDGQLSLAYQPLYWLDPHRLHGFEALVRWKHPVRGTVSPEVFIALAEECGCIQALTRWVVDEAVRQHAAWVHGGAGVLTVHVNVSGKDLSEPGFVLHVCEVLRRHTLPPALLVLEITESTLMEHREQALHALSQLTAIGVKVGIDDFGTGYSSLAYLSALPFDCLKIDRSFVKGMDASRQDLEIVRTVVSLGRTLNKQVVAEGIETHEQLKQLRQLGATIGQGYLLSRPLAPAQVQQLLAEPHVAPL